MATKILLKKSVTGGASPLTSDLDQGELAINLVDRKIYTKDSSNNITEITGAYVDNAAPSNPVEGDLWYDTTNNLLKAHNGTGFEASGYNNLSDLEDMTITAPADGELIRWDGTAFVNNTLVEADVQSISGLEASVEALLSVTDAGGDGSLTYASGVFTYTGPSAAETRAHFTGGTGVSIVAGEVAIGQPVATTDDVTFNDVIVDGNLTVNGTTTSVNTNEVNIGDSILLLNSDETGAASQNGGFEIERGTDANVSLIWNETDNKWDLGGEELNNLVLDGGSY